MKISRLFILTLFLNINLFSMQQPCPFTIATSLRNIIKSENRILPIEDMVKILVDRYANINVKNNATGWTALHVAAFYGFCDCIEPLIVAGIDVNTPDLFEQTALHVAADAGQADVLKKLLQQNANFKLVDKNGKIALDLAISNKRIQCVQILVDQYLANNVRIPEYLLKTLINLNINF